MPEGKSEDEDILLEAALKREDACFAMLPYFDVEHQNELERVVTLTEAAERACVRPQTLMYHIDRGNLAARKSGHVWLISLASLHALYKPPTAPRRPASLG